MEPSSWIRTRVFLSVRICRCYLMVNFVLESSAGIREPFSFIFTSSVTTLHFLVPHKDA